MTWSKPKYLFFNGENVGRIYQEAETVICDPDGRLLESWRRDLDFKPRYSRYAFAKSKRFKSKRGAGVLILRTRSWRAKFSKFPNDKMRLDERIFQFRSLDQAALALGQENVSIFPTGDLTC